MSYEVLDPAHLPAWADPLATDAKSYGEHWQLSKRSLLLIVPSVVARMEHNFLFNSAHPEFPRVRCGLHHAVWWDARLFVKSAGP